MNRHDTFRIKDCALIALATEERAQNLRELRDALRKAHPGTIYYHFWGGLLRPHFDDVEYNNDFAVWAFHGLHDLVLAERLGIVDPTDFDDIEGLRRELLEVIEDRLDETAWIPWAKVDRQFHFTRSQIIVFDTHREITTPYELPGVVPSLSLGSIFYHCIDSRRRNPDGADDFHSWIRGFDEDYGVLCRQLAAIDPYFVTLVQLRDQLTAVFDAFFGGTVQ